MKMNLKSQFYGIFEEQTTQKENQLYFNNVVKSKLWKNNN